MKYLIALTILCFSMPAVADQDLPAQTISHISTGWGGEGIYYTFNGGATIPGCTNTRVVIRPENPLFEEILSIGLSAFHSNTKVIFRVTGCPHGALEGISVVLIK